MTADRIRVGIIGAGQIAELHAAGYVDNPTGELCAVADVRPGVAEERARKWGVPKHYLDYRELLMDQDIDAVEILLPHDLHAAVAIEALEAGKHVSLQKPIGLSVSEGLRVSDAAARATSVFRVFENYLTYGPYIRAKQVIDAGDIGDPLAIRVKSVHGPTGSGNQSGGSNEDWRQDPLRSGGDHALLDYGHHVASVIHRLMGPVEAVHTMRPDGAVVERQSAAVPATVSWTHETGGRIGSWEMLRRPDFMAHIPEYGVNEWTEITGSRGVMWITRGRNFPPGTAPVIVHRNGTTLPMDDVQTDWESSFVRGVHDFTEAIVNGSEVGLSARAATSVLAFGLAAVYSGKSRREVRLSDLENAGAGNDVSAAGPGPGGNVRT
ncbi:MAG: Gfo/Idh/MocA family oxidoreductase [Chloroflexi bacterium]|nr:Gfo/Idh/MocA family oxidoreductase [Chloroflexota bacterium]